MNTDHRRFLPRMAICSGVLATGLPSFAGTCGISNEQLKRSSEFESTGQHLNMCGYAAPGLKQSASE